MDNGIFHVIVIGAGPAGMMASGRSAECGASALLLEKGQREGRKLLITGNGRCNITNIADKDEFIRHFGKNGRFLQNAFSRFFNDDLMNFFESRGLKLKTERGGRVFPQADRSKAVLDVLTNYMNQNRLKITHNCTVHALEKPAGSMWEVVSSQGTFKANSVVLATGGLSYPKTGSTGDGFRIAEKLGHTISKLRPGLVGIETAGQTGVILEGLSLNNVNVTLLKGNSKITSELGEMLFTDYGVSGPAILTISNSASDILAEEPNADLSISIDLKPGLNEEEFRGKLLRETTESGKVIIRNYLKQLLPARFAEFLVRKMKIRMDKEINQITHEERLLLTKTIKHFTLVVKSLRPVEEAIITQGGVLTTEINPKTMESRIAEGLFFAGEIIDVAGTSGGYNLQSAFSTGYIAGENASIKFQITNKSNLSSARSAVLCPPSPCQ